MTTRHPTAFVFIKSNSILREFYLLHTLGLMTSKNPSASLLLGFLGSEVLRRRRHSCNYTLSNLESSSKKFLIKTLINKLNLYPARYLAFNKGPNAWLLCLPFARRLCAGVHFLGSADFPILIEIYQGCLALWDVGDVLGWTEGGERRRRRKRSKLNWQSKYSEGEINIPTMAAGNLFKLSTIAHSLHLIWAILAIWLQPCSAIHIRILFLCTSLINRWKFMAVMALPHLFQLFTVRMKSQAATCI